MVDWRWQTSSHGEPDVVRSPTTAANWLSTNRRASAWYIVGLGPWPKKTSIIILGEEVETHGRYSGWLNAALGNAHYHSQDERKRAKQHTVGEPPMQITIVIVNLSRSW